MKKKIEYDGPYSPAHHIPSHSYENELFFFTQNT